jgi:hypothetical protein
MATPKFCIEEARWWGGREGAAIRARRWEQRRKNHGEEFGRQHQLEQGCAREPVEMETMCGFKKKIGAQCGVRLELKIYF